MSRVCANCFSDADLRAWIRAEGGPRGCQFCERKDAPTADIRDLGGFMRRCLNEYYGRAVDQLPHDSEEGGYIGSHWDTYDLLFEEVGLDLPRDTSGELCRALPSNISDDIWCEYDWLSLDLDDALAFSWESFCNLVKHQRRYFFREMRADYDRDRQHPEVLLNELLMLVAELGLVRVAERGRVFFRARPSSGGAYFLNANELGPPPASAALQSNRMNPPGIPMMYVAEDVKTALREVGTGKCSIGEFQLDSDTTILDLASLPEIPGIFSGAERRRRLGLVFLHHFRDEISKPVPRDDRIHVEYIPSQIITEFFRNASSEQPILGIRYPSSVSKNGANVVLFVTADMLFNLKDDERPVLQFVRAYQNRERFRRYMGERRRTQWGLMNYTDETEKDDD